MSSEKISRRKALKKLAAAAAGGLGAAAFLPSKWLKPVVESGILPVHAQTSGLCSNIHVRLDFVDDNSGTFSPLMAHTAIFTGTFPKFKLSYPPSGTVVKYTVISPAGLSGATSGSGKITTLGDVTFPGSITYTGNSPDLQVRFQFMGCTVIGENIH